MLPAIAVCGAAVLAAALALRGAVPPSEVAELTPAGVSAATTAGAPAGSAGVATLDQAIERILRCRAASNDPQDDCVGVVYFWSPLMPLSRSGVAEIEAATERLGIDLLVVDASELEVRANRSVTESTAADGLANAALVTADMLRAGATLHYPSLLVYRAGTALGSAILGYKTADAYHALLDERLGADPFALTSNAAQQQLFVADSVEWSKDFPAPGRPGAYFRSVPGRGTLAFESSETVYLLSLLDGRTEVGPGFIDFVPSPDGRLFVTPSERPRGLAFYVAEEVFGAARQGGGPSVNPIFIDPSLRDQYPSVGVLSTDGAVTVYRVLTSWFDRIVLRDYEVRTDPATGRMSVRPLAQPRTECTRVSTPILAPNGREIAGRDETSATTKIFRIEEAGGCREVEDLRVQTGKVAWAPDASRLAFAIPRGAFPGGQAASGIFVYRRGGQLSRVEGSESASRLAFPDFVGADSLVYLISPESRGRESLFRLVCCIE